MALLIDTTVVPARERLDFWSESSRDSYQPVEIRTTAKSDFSARMWGWELGPIDVFRIVAAPNTMLRTSRAIAAGDLECIHLEVVLRGRLNAAQEGRTGIAAVGDIISYETSHPAVFRADRPFESLVFRMPRALLGREAAQVSDLTAVRISGAQGLPRAAVRFFRRLAAGLGDGTIAPDGAPNAVCCVLDLVRGLYAGPPSAREPERLRSRAEILLNIESYIEANLGDPRLDPEVIARATYISTRYLHKLFEDQGTSVCAWIRNTRLDRCRRDLRDPALGHQTILAIATRWGLPGPQHFSRLFRSAYGCSPREFRRDAAQAARR